MVPTPTPQNLVLIGLMGSGKSSVGRLVAKALRFNFLDTDQLLAERAGKSISEIFAGEGEASFRARETEVLESLRPLSRCVISTGGGAVLANHNRTLMRELGFTIWLTASEEALFERVRRSSHRPLLQTANPQETLAQLMRERAPLYEEASHHCINTTALQQQDVVQAVTAAAKEAFAWTPLP
ncbi:MAG: shikimate kinase [Verrucomicrobiota bacterium]